MDKGSVTDPEEVARLVERLRDRAQMTRHGFITHTAGVLDEAADALERLAAENAQLRSELDTTEGPFENVDDCIAALRATRPAAVGEPWRPFGWLYTPADFCEALAWLARNASWEAMPKRLWDIMNDARNVHERRATPTGDRP